MPMSSYMSAVIFLLLFTVKSWAKKNHYFCSNPQPCGNLEKISYPFGLLGSSMNCGDPNYLLSCENNNAVLHLFSGKYFVKEINYQNKTIRLVDVGLQEKNCSSLPLFPLTFNNFSFYQFDYRLRWRDKFPVYAALSDTVMFVNCKNPVSSSLYVRTSPCFGSTSNHSYVMSGDAEVSDIPDMCRIEFAAMMSSPGCWGKKECSYLDILDAMLHGFQLSWDEIYCEQCKGKGHCKFKGGHYLELVGCSSIGGIWVILFWLESGMMQMPMALGARCFFGTPCIVAFLIYKWRRRHLSMYDTVEDFLRNHNNLMPIMYSNSDIKKMTRSFKEKLGEGAFGSVYKGKLSSGRIVAIKVLGKSKANGQEFINEVATIGRIHHFNVVHLIGFCAEGSKRALVYEYMPNGSLEKHIFSKHVDVSPLSCEIMYQISLGIARGIEYLHRGCNMQILHFDIKPHNILLDENFTPKVSDFGLAKLYSTRDSIVSLTAPRGTMGYMAPELFYKNIGGISYKADVYSFGMLLMEMVGRRKNLNAFADHSSQIYFPTWVYGQFNEGKDVEIEDATEEEKRLTKKMLIVALWSIQMKPSDRPSMNRVVEMLEGEIESLQMPPKPFLSPQEIHQLENRINKETIPSPDSLSDSIEAATSDLSST